jgi:hypothetical protein
MRLHNLFPDTLMNFTEFSETIESRMTAWALGELPPDEAVAFEAAMAADPVLAAEAERTKAFCGVLDGNLAQAPVVLARAERERLLSAASAPVVVPFSWRRGLTALAACVAAGTAGTTRPTTWARSGARRGAWAATRPGIRPRAGRPSDAHTRLPGRAPLAGFFFREHGMCTFKASALLGCASFGHLPCLGRGTQQISRRATNAWCEVSGLLVGKWPNIAHNQC